MSSLIEQMSQYTMRGEPRTEAAEEASDELRSLLGHRGGRARAAAVVAVQHETAAPESAYERRPSPRRRKDNKSN